MKALRLSLVVALFAALSLVQTGSAALAASFTLFGDAALVSPGHNSATAVRVRSTFPGGSGGIDFAIPAGMTLSQLTNLSTDYMFTESSCGGGSPRFQINIDGKNIFVYLGAPPNYTLCSQNIWTNTGNLVTAASLVDTSQLPGGTFYDPWTSALVKYGTHTVTGIQFVADASWFFNSNQTVVVDNVMINDTTYSFESTTGGGGGGGGKFSQCKNGGWKTFTSAPGPFKNQGQCVSHFARQEQSGGGGDDEQGDDDDEGDD